MIFPSATLACFNTQPPEGGWLNAENISYLLNVSTHSRLKAAGAGVALRNIGKAAFQHTAA